MAERKDRFVPLTVLHKDSRRSSLPYPGPRPPREGNSATLILGAKPAGHQNGVAPAAHHITARIHISPDTIVAMVLAGGIINVEDDEFRSSVAIQIGHGNSATLILGAKPAGDADGIAPAACLRCL